MSDRIQPGRHHPNRPLPTFEFSLDSDLETRQKNPEALAAAGEGIYDVIELMGRQPDFNNQLIGQESALSNLMGAFEQTNPGNGLRQINIEEFAYYLAREGALDPKKPLYFVTSKDVFERGLNFMFGITIADLGISAQSTYRFKEVSRDPSWIMATTKLMARHEFGHLVGLGQSTIKNQDPRPGIYTGHCINSCTMRQVMSVADVSHLLQELEDRPNAGFCDDCAASLSHLGSHR